MDNNLLQLDFVTAPQIVVMTDEEVELRQIAGEINNLFHSAELKFKRGFEDVLIIGNKLIKAKIKVKRARLIWEEWVKGNLDITKRHADRYIHVAKKSPELLEMGHGSPISNFTISGAIKQLAQNKKAERKEKIAKQKEDIATGKAILPEGKFEVIVIDPPWPYGTEYDPETRRAASPYPEMSLEEIAAIELPAPDDCILWLWTTHRFMRHSFPLLDKWGFQEVAIVTWEKDQMGLGGWLRSKSEFCIMAVKGHPIIDLTNQTTIIHGAKREHSRKPDEFYKMVDELCIGRKLDYFSREVREGWSSFGNDIERFSGE